MLKAHLDFTLLDMCCKCGACYDICPSCIALPGYDPRAVIRDILDGSYEKWLESQHIWQCLECHHCLEMCYQHYGFENAMTAMRMLATKKGIYPPQVKRGWAMFEKTGKLGEPSKPGRKKYGLPPATESGGEELKRLLAILREETGETGPAAKG